MNTPERVVDILDTLAAAPGPLGVSEVSRHLGIGKNNVFRILTALECKGWVQQDDETKKYRLTGAMAGVALKALSQLDIQKVSLPYLHELQAATGETTALCIRVDLERMFISSVPSNQEVRQIVPLGNRLPLWYGSGGKVILAFMTEPEIETVLSLYRDSKDPNHPGSQAAVDALTMELEEIRKQGFATGVGQRNPSVCGIAAPIFNHDQKVVGSLGVSGPMPRLNLERALQYSSLLKENAQKISSLLGARAS